MKIDPAWIPVMFLIGVWVLRKVVTPKRKNNTEPPTKLKKPKTLAIEPHEKDINKALASDMNQHDNFEETIDHKYPGGRQFSAKTSRGTWITWLVEWVNPTDQQKKK